MLRSVRMCSPFALVCLLSRTRVRLTVSTSAPVLAALRRSAPLLALSPINPASYGGGTTGGANGPDADELIADEMMKFDPLLAAVATFITAIMGGCLYWGIQDRSAEKAKQDLAMMEDLKEEMKAKFGVTEAQCEAAAATASSTDMRAAVVAASAGKKFSPESAAAVYDSNPIIGEDYVLAPYWKRLISFVLDNLSTNALVFALQMLAVKARPDLEDTMLTGPTALICSFLTNVLVETFSLMYFDGRTIGKFITGLKLIRQDQEKVRARASEREHNHRPQPKLERDCGSARQLTPRSPMLVLCLCDAGS